MNYTENTDRSIGTKKKNDHKKRRMNIVLYSIKSNSN